MKKYLKYSLTLLAASVIMMSCHKDLDRFPTNDNTSAQVYNSVDGYKQVLAKVYGSQALTGNSGPAGSGDVAGIDEGTSDFLRLFWMAQELSTDEAVVAWNDIGVQDFHNMNWSSNNPMLNGLYNRCFYTITMANEFIRESTADKAGGRGVDFNEIKPMRAEARFIRAFQYWVLMDLYGRPGFTDETTPFGGSVLPIQKNRTEIFDYVVSELTAIESELMDPRTNEYGRVDKAAAWALLARVYLNAEVYTGTAKYAEALTYAKKVIDAGYTLLPEYQHLFLADNNIGNTEVIWSLNYDGVRSKNFGGTTFIINGSVNGDNAEHKDIGGLTGWSGLRTTKNLPELFAGYPNFNLNALIDSRALFYTNGQSVEISDISKFVQGYAVVKFRNRTKTGGFGNDPERGFSDVDFPVFRLAEMYLIYAEAFVKGGGGSAAEALVYFNRLRERAFKNTSNNVGALSADLILDERARELYWEGFRRTDLVRYNKFVSAGYLWPWKGGAKNGTGVASYRKIYPIPSTEVAANPNISQNPNY